MLRSPASNRNSASVGGAENGGRGNDGVYVWSDLYFTQNPRPMDCAKAKPPPRRWWKVPLGVVYKTPASLFTSPTGRATGNSGSSYSRAAVAPSTARGVQTDLCVRDCIPWIAQGQAAAEALVDCPWV